MYVSRDTGRVRRDNEVGTTILTSGGAIALTIAYSILSRAWRVAGEEGRYDKVRVMTHIRV